MYLIRTVIVTTIIFASGVVKADENQTSRLPGHQLAIFVGGGIEKDHKHSEAGAALGLKYELRVHEAWSAGFDVEKLTGSETDRSEVVAITLGFHPTENWRLFFGPGYEFHGKKDKALLRIGVAYEWELQHHWSLSPELIADFLDGGAKTYVAGFSLGYHF